MRVIVEFEIETPDYSGRTFLKTIMRLLKEIDPRDTKLLTFKMREKSPHSSWDERAIDWVNYAE